MVLWKPNSFDLTSCAKDHQTVVCSLFGVRRPLVLLAINSTRSSAMPLAFKVRVKKRRSHHRALIGLARVWGDGVNEDNVRATVDVTNLKLFVSLVSSHASLSNNKISTSKFINELESETMSDSDGKAPG